MPVGCHMCGPACTRCILSQMHILGHSSGVEGVNITKHEKLGLGRSVFAGFTQGRVSVTGSKIV